MRHTQVPQQDLNLRLRTVATPAGFEPATSGVTGRHSDQLNYEAKMESPVFLTQPSYPELRCGFSGVLPVTANTKLKGV